MHVYFIPIKSLKTIIMFRHDPTPTELESLGPEQGIGFFIKVLQSSPGWHGSAVRTSARTQRVTI